MGSCFIVVLIIPQMFWLVDSQITKSIGKLIDYLEDELIAVFSPVSLPGTIHVFISFFLFIIFFKLYGTFSIYFYSYKPYFYNVDPGFTHLIRKYITIRCVSNKINVSPPCSDRNPWGTYANHGNYCSHYWVLKVPCLHR